MKRLIFIALVAYSVANAQTGKNKFGIDNYVDVPKGKCKIDHKCRLQYHYDEFEKFTSYKTDGFYGSNPNGFYGKAISIYFVKSITEKGDSVIFGFFSGNVTGCVTKESSIYVLFKDGNKITLPYSSGEIRCGLDYMMVTISDENAKSMRDNPISKIRFNYSDATDDFEVSEKGQERIIDRLKCIIDIN